MKRIGVITYWNSKDNYGQVLQCYALQKYLQQKGYEAFLIRYRPIDKEKNFFWRGIYMGKLFLYAKLLPFVSPKQKKAIEMQKQEEWGWKEAFRNAEQCQFDDFRDEYIVSTKKIYSSIDELRENPPQADAYICGSDQVWYNDLNVRNTAGWFLNFGNARRISYAASIGRKLNPKEEEKFRLYVESFYSVSVREESAALFCKKIGIERVKVCVDPTLLLSKDSYLFPSKQEVNQHNTIFVYAINVENRSALYWEEIAFYAEKNNLEMKICCSSGYLYAREIVDGYHNLHLSIQEWIMYINESKYVITTSFHGTVFCILFHTPFVVIPLKGRYEKANDRIITLLKMTGLQQRYFNGEKSLELILNEEIEWETVDNRLSKYRGESEIFLMDSLKDL